MPARIKRTKKRITTTKSKLFSKKLAKTLGLIPYGDAGFLVLVGVAVFAFLLAGGIATFSQQNYGIQGNLITPIPSYGVHTSNQLHTLTFMTVTPTSGLTAIPTNGAQQAQCKGNLNEEPETFRASDPVPPQVALAGGQLKVWATDENTPFIAPNEVVDNTTGKITTPGNRTAQDGKGHIIEPRLYIDSDNIVSNLHPYYPDYVKGDYSAFSGGSKGPGFAMDPLPAGAKPSDGHDDEYVWNVTSLGLALGTHQVQFVFHDGDDDQGLGCFLITI